VIRLSMAPLYRLAGRLSFLTAGGVAAASMTLLRRKNFAACDDSKAHAQVGKLCGGVSKTCSCARAEACLSPVCNAVS
jgi:hypothetical protein